MAQLDFMLRVGIWLVLAGWLVWRLCIGCHAVWEWYSEHDARMRRLDGPHR